VTVLDNFATGLRSHVPAEAQLAEGDVGDAAFVDEVLGGGRFDAVLHIAGQASISKSFQEPEADVRTNVLGTVNVLRGCVAAGVPRLVHASSMTIYGEPEHVPTPESEPCVPVSYYGVTKLAAERYVHITAARPDVELAVTSLRMFNVYGERQSISNPYQGVLAIFLGNVLRREPITIHGDGAQTRDFVYVGDVVEAWASVLDDAETYGKVFNVGSGHETSVSELADGVLGALGETRASWDVRTTQAQLGDQRRSGADISSISARGWSPKTALSAGLERTVAWASGGAGAPGGATSDRH
jgi:UDP-glucose 4-epimerase